VASVCALLLHEHDYRRLTGDSRTRVVAQRHEFEGIVRDMLEAAARADRLREVDSDLAMLQYLNMHNYTYSWVGPDGPWSADELRVNTAGRRWQGWGRSVSTPWRRGSPSC
jgi:hypothetical protein